MTLAETRLMTADDLLNLPDDPDVERDLIEGELRETAVTRRNYSHSRIQMTIGHVLLNWKERTKSKGTVVGGEAGVRLRKNPDTMFGVDVAYVPDRLTQDTAEAASFIDGVPLLMVEILSPSDTHQRIAEKVDRYLAAGVMLVWIVDPRIKLITVCRPDGPPVAFNETQNISGEPHLPGFEVPVREIFAV